MKKWALVLGLVMAQMLVAAEDAKDQIDELNNPKNATFLQIYKAKDTNDRLKDRNLYYVHVLEIIVNNFGSEHKAELQKIKDLYVEAKGLYYMHQYAAAAQKFQKNEKQINDLFGKFTKMYEDKAEEILKKCAFGLTDVELNKLSNEPGTNLVNVSRLVRRNRHRLRVGYEKLRLGKRMLIDNRQYDAIKHFRQAKGYGIAILEDLAADKDSKNKITAEYRTDLIDNQNVMAKK